MLDKYYRFLYYIMGYAFGLVRKSKKCGMHIYRFTGVRVIFLNDYENRRLIVWFFHESTRRLHRMTMHHYYVRITRKKIVDIVKKIQEDENYWDEVLVRKKSMSYKKELAYIRYTNYINRKK